MKKASIAVDVLALGELGEGQKNRLLTFNTAVNSGENSSLVFI